MANFNFLHFDASLIKKLFIFKPYLYLPHERYKTIDIIVILFNNLNKIACLFSGQIRWDITNLSCLVTALGKS